MARLFSASPTSIWNFTVNNLYGCRIATGTYTGDGTLAQAITGVGFQPKVVMVAKHDVAESGIGTIVLLMKSDTMAGDLSVYFRGDQSLDNRLISLDADGFTVDDDNGDFHPNKNAQLYDYIAWG